jgi:multidrug efflux system membrane fusion protein
VAAGALLAKIDPRTFQVALDQAAGQLAHDQSQLADARVDLDR